MKLLSDLCTRQNICCGKTSITGKTSMNHADGRL